MANLLGTIHTKFYQNGPCFMEDKTKTFWCVFGSQYTVSEKSGPPTDGDLCQNL